MNIPSRIRLYPALFYSVALLHLVLWTLLPVFARFTLSHDAIEAFVWSQHLTWGYDKNPYFVGWVTHFAFWLSHGNVWGYYFIQQLFIVLGLWSIWQLSRRLFGEKTALVATFVLEGCLYFTAYVMINNDNFLLLGLLPFAASMIE